MISYINIALFPVLKPGTDGPQIFKYDPMFNTKRMSQSPTLVIF